MNSTAEHYLYSCRIPCVWYHYTALASCHYRHDLVQQDAEQKVFTKHLRKTYIDK